MFDGKIDITGIMLFRDEAKSQGKSEDYLMALSDLIVILQKNQENHKSKQKENLEKLNKRRNNSVSTEPVILYFYERRADGSIKKHMYEAVEKKNSYEVKSCWRSRISKNNDINKFTDCLHHAMWTDAENDELAARMRSGNAV